MFIKAISTCKFVFHALAPLLFLRFQILASDQMQVLIILEISMNLGASIELASTSFGS